MTLDELNAHLVALQELETARDLLRTLEAADLTAHRLDGIPHAPGATDQTAALAVKIAEQRETVSKFERITEASNIPVKAFIDSVSDNRLNVILYLRFICGYEWQAVANIIGGRNTVDSVKSLVYRFFRLQTH